MKKFVKKVHIYFSHFQTKLLSAFLLCTLIPLSIIGGISYLVSHRLAESKILDAAFSSDKQLNMQINDRLLQTENAADSLQYDMYTLKQTKNIQDALNTLADTRSDADLFKSSFDLTYISFFLPENEMGANENLYFFPLSYLDKYAIPKEQFENPGTSSIWFYQPSLQVPFVASGTNEEKNCIGCCRILKNSGTKSIDYAYILFSDCSIFSDMLKETFHEKAISSYLVTNTGQVIAHNDETFKNNFLSEEHLDFIVKNKNSVTKDAHITYHSTELANGWFHVTEIPDSYINKNIRILIGSIVISVLSFLPVTVFVVILFSKSLTRRIKKLSNAMETLQLDSNNPWIQDLIPAQKAEETYDEIDRLCITFQKMQSSLNQNLQSILDLSLAEERLKYQLLQSQINPHFLYNILGSIQTCQSIGKLDTANAMLTNLTRFYRMTLRKSGDLITIRDELEIARLYMEIEKLCHKNELTWKITMEDGIENFLICKFTLQPFLENSILHGISQRTPTIHINIQISYGDDTVIIEISDNGIGMGEKQLNQLKETLHDKIVNYEKHFGIGNVNKRISNPYFGNGHISVESCMGYGTTIRIEFDQMEEDNEKGYDCR